MQQIPEFKIEQNGEISKEFLSRNILTFSQAALFVSQLPYGRNQNKNNLLTVFTDNCGTCSTKHALLKKLAQENNFNDLKLFIGLYKMNGINTPKVLKTLKTNNLEFIPEAHNYLKFNDTIFDFTVDLTKPLDFISDLIEEIEILPNQIVEYKINYHKNYLKDWLNKNVQIKLSLSDLWKIREQCIQDLATNI